MSPMTYVHVTVINILIWLPHVRAQLIVLVGSTLHCPQSSKLTLAFSYSRQKEMGQSDTGLRQGGHQVLVHERDCPF